MLGARKRSTDLHGFATSRGNAQPSTGSSSMARARPEINICNPCTLYRGRYIGFVRRRCRPIDEAVKVVNFGSNEAADSAQNNQLLLGRQSQSTGPESALSRRRRLLTNQLTNQEETSKAVELENLDAIHLKSLSHSLNSLR